MRRPGIGSHSIRNADHASAAGRILPCEMLIMGKVEPKKT